MLTNFKPRRGLAVTAALIAMGAALAGCGNGVGGPTVDKPLSNNDVQIKAIQDNPNMPADMKAKALSRLEQAKTQGQSLPKK